MSPQGVQVNPDSENVPAGHSTTPFRSSFGTLPGKAERQDDAPDREYSPGPLQGSHDNPDSENVPAGQSTTPFRSSFGTIPGKAELQNADPVFVEYSPGSPHGKQVVAA